MKHRSRLIVALLCLIAPLTGAQAQLIVHEWGTMTTLHAPDGRAQARLNLITEDLLPRFVHHFEPPQREGRAFAPFAKGPGTSGRPDVTMRLETPVLYFYDPGNVIAGRSFDVRVQMRGGVLNDFFPFAQSGMQRHGVDRGRSVEPISLDASWSGTLAWTGIALDSTVTVPQTRAPVWLAPRKVGAHKVSVGKEGEHYLFYRGLANLSALLSTRHSPKAVTLSAPPDLSWIRDEPTMISQIWLVDVRADGSLAFATRRDLPLSKHAATAPLAQMTRFVTTDFSKERTAALWSSMKTALVSAGLYADEAEAMLQTWRASYFGKPGLRVFYTVPRSWTDHFLPLELSVPHQATRVLIGRIDLMSSDETT